jgi:hypothetical protein
MGKTDNLTIRIEPDLKKRAELLRAKHFKRVPMNIFLEMMLEYGMDVQEGIAKYEQQVYSNAVKDRVHLYAEDKKHEEIFSIIGDEGKKEKIEKRKKHA